MSRVHDHVYTEWRGGTCRVKWWTGEYHKNGRKRYESKGGFTDVEAAVTHGRDKLYEIRHGTHVSNRDGATLMTDWLDDWLDSADLAPTTERSYRAIINKHIRPYFERKTVAQIDVIAYRSFRKYAQKALPGSYGNAMMLLGMILDDAVPRLIATSPVERSTRRGKYKKSKRRERKRDMLIEDVDRLALNAEVVFGYAGYVFVWTAAMTGMRPGELYGLTREYCYPNWPASDPRADPDEVDRYDEEALRYGQGEGLMPAIRVERQVQFGDDGLAFCPPKYLSYRTLVIPPFLADMLEKLLASHDLPWVFPSLQGKSLGVASFDRIYWRPIADGADARKAGSGISVAQVRPAIERVEAFAGKRKYLIRHGHKAWLDEDGHSRFAVESRMGHEVPGVEGTYSSVTVKMEQAIMASLQARWERFRAAQQS